MSAQRQGLGKELEVGTGGGAWVEGVVWVGLHLGVGTGRWSSEGVVRGRALGENRGDGEEGGAYISQGSTGETEPVGRHMLRDFWKELTYRIVGAGHSEIRRAGRQGEQAGDEAALQLGNLSSAL